MPKAKSKIKAKTPSAKEPVVEKSIPQQTRTIVTIILLVLTFYVPLLGLIGLIMMWVWTNWKIWVKILITLPFALLVLSTVLLVVYINAFRPFQMSGNSMLPNYKPGAYMVSSIFHQGDAITRSGVIIFRNPLDRKKYHIKRIIGFPGETVMIKNGSVFINGTTLDESSYLSSSVGTATVKDGFMKEGKAVKIPPESYFVLGDNRSESVDSRMYGFVPAKDITSEVRFCYWNCR